MDNFVDLGADFLRRGKLIVFLDTEKAVGRRILSRNEVPVRNKSFVPLEGEKYFLSFCRVQEKDMPRFVRAMDELKNTMLIFGHTDYEPFFESFLRKVEEDVERKMTEKDEKRKRRKTRRCRLAEDCKGNAEA